MSYPENYQQKQLDKALVLHFLLWQTPFHILLHCKAMLRYGRMTCPASCCGIWLSSLLLALFLRSVINGSFLQLDEKHLAAEVRLSFQGLSSVPVSAGLSLPVITTPLMLLSHSNFPAVRWDLELSTSFSVLSWNSTWLQDRIFFLWQTSFSSW